MGVPQKTLDRENLKFSLKFSVLVLITSWLWEYLHKTFPGHVMNFGPHIDPREVLVHCKLTQVHTPRGSFRGHSNHNHVKAYWCPVKRRFTTMVGTTYEPCGLVEYNKKLSCCWETVRRVSMPRIAEVDVEMTT